MPKRTLADVMSLGYFPYVYYYKTPRIDIGGSSGATQEWAAISSDSCGRQRESLHLKAIVGWYMTVRPVGARG